MYDEETALLRRLDALNKKRVRVNDHALPALRDAVTALDRYVATLPDAPGTVADTMRRLARHVVQAYEPMEQELTEWRQI